MSICKHCDKPVRAIGLCGQHYMRWYKHGDATVNTNARKLTEEKALAILEMAPFMTYREIAAKFNISLSHVGQIALGLKWKHLKRRADDYSNWYCGA
jgi:hypothetical protein